MKRNFILCVISRIIHSELLIIFLQYSRFKVNNQPFLVYSTILNVTSYRSCLRLFRYSVHLLYLLSFVFASISLFRPPALSVIVRVCVCFVIPSTCSICYCSCLRLFRYSVHLLYLSLFRPPALSVIRS